MPDDPHLDGVEAARGVLGHLLLSLVAGVAVAQVVDEALASYDDPDSEEGIFSGRLLVAHQRRSEVLRAEIKWPNDIYVTNDKIAGVLVEAVTRGDAPPDIVIGIGLNVATRIFPPEIAQPATSLALLGRGGADRAELIAGIAARLAEQLDSFIEHGPRATLLELERRDWLCGRSVQVGAVQGIAVGVDEHGQLEIRDRMGAVHAVMTGEVSVNRRPGVAGLKR
jgi:biotin-[acetyl-CoA-carboxylase] ligase BirA-like protein